MNHGISYTGWAWWVEKEKPDFPCLISSWEGMPLYGGKYVHDDIKQHPGTRMGA